MTACRICGCTDDDCSQCIDKTGEPCCWVEADLCSACEGTFEQLAQDAERSAAEAGFNIKDAFDQIRAALREGACTQEDAVEAVTAAFAAVDFNLPVHQGAQLMADVANKQRARGTAGLHPADEARDRGARAVRSASGEGTGGRLKKPLSKCQQCQQALEACRQLVADGGRVRDQLREQVKHLEGQLKTAESELLEARQALLEGAQALRNDAAAARRNTLAQGAQPSWLVKDFNVLYRVAVQYFDATDNGRTRAAQRARRDLGIQLERLKSAFTDTEEVKRLLREGA